MSSAKTQFKKGQIPWNKGNHDKRKPLSQEIKEKIRLANLGKKRSPEATKKISDSKRGKKQSIETIKKRMESRKKRGVWHTPETIEKMKKNHKGSTGKHWKLSEETKKRQSLAQSREKNPSWKGGKTPEKIAIRMSKEYKLWRTAVFERDNYTCIWCGQKGGKLNADHIKPFAYFPELRFAIDNGRTLCIDCHRKTDTYGNKFINNLAGH